MREAINKMVESDFFLPYHMQSYHGRVDGMVKMFLHSNDEIIREYWLKKIHFLLDEHWHELYDFLPQIVKTLGTGSERHNDLVRLLISRIYFYINDCENAIRYALEIKNIFQKGTESEYVQACLVEILKRYIQALKAKNTKTLEKSPKSNNSSQLKFSLPSEDMVESSKTILDFKDAVCVVNRLLDEAAKTDIQRQIIGIALELRRLDIIDSILKNCDDKKSIIQYIISLLTKHFLGSSVFIETIVYLIEHLKTLVKPDFFTLFYCLQITQNSEEIAKFLINLTVDDPDNEDDYNIATQLCFDLYENVTRDLVEKILRHVKHTDYYREGKRLTFDCSSRKTKTSDSVSYVTLSLENKRKVDSARIQTLQNIQGMSQEEITIGNNEIFRQQKNEFTKYIYEKLTKLIIILRGKATSRLWFSFLIKNFSCDAQILKHAKVPVGSLLVSGISFANSFIHCGTAIDTFLREQISLFGSSSHWSKFNYVSSIGVIHMGNQCEGVKLLTEHLPKITGGNINRKHEESGAFVALGFIYSDNSSKSKDILLKHFNACSDPVLLHGCCLGLGLSCLGSQDKEVSHLIWKKVELNNPITTLGAAVGYGLVNLGAPTTLSSKLFIEILKNTKHEKVKLGLGLMFALMMIKRGNLVNSYFETFFKYQDSRYRLAATYALGTAFVGTGDSRVVKKLWSIVLLETDDQVKRAAIISLGFVLIRDRAQLYDIMTQFFCSHNAAIRAAAVFTLGMVFVGTGNPDAYKLICSLHKDLDIRVRYSSYIAVALLMMHLNEVNAPNSKFARENIFQMMTTTKHVDPLVKFGAIIASGIIDAGGKVMCVSYFTSDGSIRVRSIVGMLLFSASHYWFPFINFLTLSFVPGAIICVKSDFSIPVIKMQRVRPSYYYANAFFASQAKRTSKKRYQGFLSIHRRTRKYRKPPVIMLPKYSNKDVEKTPQNKNVSQKSPQENESMDNQLQPILFETTSKDPKNKESYQADKKESARAGEENKYMERFSEGMIEQTIVENPLRILPHLYSTIRLLDGTSHVPYKPITKGGIIVVKKVTQEPEKLVYEPLQVKVVSTTSSNAASQPKKPTE